MNNNNTIKMKRSRLNYKILNINKSGIKQEDFAQSEGEIYYCLLKLLVTKQFIGHYLYYFWSIKLKLKDASSLLLI